MWKSLYNKREREKRVRRVVLGQKLTLNHQSMVDEGEKTKILVKAHKREKGKRETQTKINSMINAIIKIIILH